MQRTSAIPILGRADGRLVIAAGASVLFSVLAWAAGALGLMPSGWSAVIVMLGTGMILRAVWMYAARSASTANRARVINIVSNVGLSVSGLALIVCIPRITKSSGLTVMVVDTCAQLWSLALLSAAAAPVRTVGWRAFVGTFLFGFLGLNGLARFVGRPMIVKFGTASVFAVGIWVPITEELCKLLPVAWFLYVALKRTEQRPALLDLALLGAWGAAGFAISENAALGRGLFSLTANPVLSLFFPSSLKGAAYGWTVMQTGHLVHTALIALGVGFAYLYRHRLRRAWIPAVISVAAVLIEHCSQNSIGTGHINRVIGKALLLLTLNGRLCALLLIGGVVYAAFLEWRITGNAGRWLPWRRLPAAEAKRRGALLATAQTGRNPRIAAQAVTS